MHMFTDDEKKFIQKHAMGCGNAELTAMVNEHFGLNLGINQIKAFKKNHYISSGLDGRFGKGSVPYNKGKKKYWIGGEETQFKKGNRPHNWVPLGTERVTKDGYIQVKIDEGKFQHNWKGKHILIWESHNGPVPKGYCIIFGDGNNRNFDINNLISVSRNQLKTLNQKSLIQNDAELTRTAVVIADVFIKISDRKKHGRG